MAGEGRGVGLTSAAGSSVFLTGTGDARKPIDVGGGLNRGAVVGVGAGDRAIFRDLMRGLAANRSPGSGGSFMEASRSFLSLRVSTRAFSSAISRLNISSRSLSNLIVSRTRFLVTGEKGEADLLSLPFCSVGDGWGETSIFSEILGGVTSDGSGWYSLFKYFFLIFSGFSKSSRNIRGIRGNNAGLSIFAPGSNGIFTILIIPFRFIVQLFELNEDCFK